MEAQIARDIIMPLKKFTLTKQKLNALVQSGTRKSSPAPIIAGASIVTCTCAEWHMKK